MPAKLIDYRVIKGERCWTYEAKITFNGRKITAVTITDYYQKKKGRKMITNESILEMLKRLRRLRPTKYQGKRKELSEKLLIDTEPIVYFSDLLYNSN